MADTYTNRLGLIAQEEGQHSNEWGDLLNLNFQRLDSAVRGYTQINLVGPESLDANDITTTGSTAQEESFFQFIEFKGTASTVTVPAENIMWIVYNNSDGNFTFQPSGGTGVTLIQGKVHFIVYGSNGTTFTDVTPLINLGTLSILNVDNIQIDGNTITTTTGGLTLDSNSGTTTILDNVNVDNDLLIDSTVAGIGFVGRQEDTGIMRYGGANDSNGSYLQLNGDNHVNALDITFRAGGVTTDTDIWAWDESTGNHTIKSGTGSPKTLALTIDASQNTDVVGDLTALTVNADGDTSAGDNAAMGYTATEGLILTGQGSTNDVTIKNDADADVIKIPTGTTNVDIVGALTVNAGETVVSVPAQVTDHIRAGNVQIWDGDGASAGIEFDVVANMAATTWETVGPTGSGATNIWAKLDVLPTSATILIADIYLDIESTTSGDCAIIAFATEGSGTATESVSNQIARLWAHTDAANEDFQSISRVMIALDSNQTFRVTWQNTNITANSDVLIWYRGFITD